MARGLSAYSPPFFILLAILGSCLWPSSLSRTIVKNATPLENFSVGLIHRDSPLSPFYDPDSTIYDQSRGLIRRSMARLQYLQSLFKASPDLVTAPVTSVSFEYVVKFSVGTPPSEITAILDTGGRAMWFQCLPCKQCFEQSKPIFDPSKSSTYRNLACDSPPCEKLASSSCEDGLCQYKSTYADGSFSMGSFATETFTFDTADAQNISFPDIAFGCGHENGGIYKGDLGGVLSLGRDPLSLISQLNVRQFSHCFFPPGDHSVSHLKLVVAPSLTGKTTSIIQVEGSATFYYVSLDDISLGSEALHIPPGAFKPSPSQGLILDTGTSLTILDSSGFDLVLQAVRKEVKKLKEIPDPAQKLELCYEGYLGDLNLFPHLTFHFPGGADLILGLHGEFLAVADKVVCLAMLRSDGGVSVIGNLAMQNYIIGYDMVKNEISFEPSNCLNF